MPDYGEVSYWDQRYAANDTSFDWYLPYSSLRDLLFPLLEEKRSSGGDVRILVVGCGNSRLSAHLHDDGFHNVTSIDASDVVILQMKGRTKDKDGLQFMTMDVKKMSVFGNDSFDVVIDKGCMDAILCGQNSTSNVLAMNREIIRVLKPGGIFFEVSYGQPEVRTEHIRRKQLPWNIQHQTIVKAFLESDGSPTQTYHVYIMRKTADASAAASAAVPPNADSIEHFFDNLDDVDIEQSEEDFALYKKMQDELRSI